MPSDKVSVIIVSHNSEKTITFCLDSVLQSDIADQIELIVVDNNSRDRTRYFIDQFEKHVILISNNENLGFSRACNQGARASTGDYLLFLNPDCLLAEDAITILLKELNARKEDAGAIGPLLINGEGKVLPESARGIPTFTNGLAHFLKFSLRRIPSYHRKIDFSKTFETPVLAGACFLIEKVTFEAVGGFDERYFMYGEDIDLSISLGRIGKKNYCSPSAKIIHFKGESSNRPSLSNRWQFYKSIGKYLQKWKLDSEGIFQKLLLKISLLFATTIDFIKLSARTSAVVIRDFIIVMFGFFIIQFLWSYIKSGHFFYFESFRYVLNYCFYSALLIITLYLNGYFDEHSKRLQHLFRGMTFGIVGLLVVYALLPEAQRFSRAILLIAPGSLFVFFLMRDQWVKKKLIVSWNIISNDPDHPEVKNKAVLLSANINGEQSDGQRLLFDTSSLTVRKMIELMTNNSSRLQFEFWDRDRDYSFISSSPEKQGTFKDRYAPFRLYRSQLKMQKRLVDIVLCLILLIPAFIVQLMRGKIPLTNIGKIWNGRMTFVGFDRDDLKLRDVPGIKESLVCCYPKESIQQQKIERVIDYAANYSVVDDIFVIAQNLPTVLNIL